mgnify:CR=1 FL=1
MSQLLFWVPLGLFWANLGFISFVGGGAYYWENEFLIALSIIVAVVGVVATVVATVVAAIVLIVWLARKGDASPNKYGPDPRRGTSQLPYKP